MSFAALLRLAIQEGHAGGRASDAEMRFGYNLGPDGETPERETSIFEQRSRFRTFEAGDEIITAGDARGDVYFILEGAVEAIDPNTEDAGTELGLSDSAAHLVEESAGNGHARKARFIAARTTHVAILSHSDMADLIEADPSIAAWLGMQMADCLNEPS